jgi:hypothetical protein
MIRLTIALIAVCLTALTAVAQYPSGPGMGMTLLVSATLFGDEPEKPKPTATDQMLRDLDGEVNRSRNAQRVFDQYEAFAAAYILTPQQRTMIDNRIKLWGSRIDQGLVNVGGNWISAEAAQAIGK